MGVPPPSLVTKFKNYENHQDFTILQFEPKAMFFCQMWLLFLFTLPVSFSLADEHHHHQHHTFNNPLKNASCAPGEKIFDPDIKYDWLVGKPKVNQVLALDKCSLFSNDRFVANGQNNEDVKILKRFFTSSLSSGKYDIKRNLFFLEMGGLNGVTFSNTLIAEYCFGWTGMLIEANMHNYHAMTLQRPCTINIWGATCPQGSAGHVFLGDTSGTSAVEGTRNYQNGFGSGKIQNSETLKYQKYFDIENTISTRRSLSNHKSLMTPCRSMKSIFYEYNIQWIDFWSLDVEGSELVTLQSVDWTAVKVGVLIIEFNVNDGKIEQLLTTEAHMFKMSNTGSAADMPPNCHLKKKGMPSGLGYLHNSQIFVHESLRDDLPCT